MFHLLAYAVMALEAAVINGHHDIADRLRNAASDRQSRPNNRTDQHGKTALMEAIEQGNNDLVTKMLARADLDPTIADDQGRTALYYTARENNLNAVKTLLKHQRTNPNAMTLQGATPLYIAAQKNNIQVLKALLEHRATDVNIPLDQNGATPLYIAAHKGHVSVVDALLRCASIKANQPTLEGATPLWIAASRGHQQIVRRLVDHPNLKFNSRYAGDTASTIAAKNKHTEIVSMVSAAYTRRASAAMREGLPIPFGGKAIDIATMITSQKAEDAVAAWRNDEVPESDLQQMHTDLLAYMLYAKEGDDEKFNTRYQHFIKDLAVHAPELRRFFVRLQVALPALPQ